MQSSIQIYTDSSQNFRLGGLIPDSLPRFTSINLTQLSDIISQLELITLRFSYKALVSQHVHHHSYRLIYYHERHDAHLPKCV